MKGLIVAGVAGLLGIGGVIGANAAMQPSSDPVAVTAAAPDTARALEQRIARLTRARRAAESAHRSRTRTGTVEDRVAAPARPADDAAIHQRRGRGTDDALEGNAGDDRGGDRIGEDDDRGGDRIGEDDDRGDHGRGGDDD